ncbi:hypothetical protein C7Y71_002000 [Pseudoprevotella muciniphila]|uniref:Uncharacterized protein n=1 Tax=Pseudoprevotella muciniphila TaxID=2133944 RepID=A0A5P8E4P3_9BACT|nr:hypothetical protein C7Y71_002000 [Pseudoprevotella muciniphila]
MIDSQYKCAYLWAPKVTPRDSIGTQNWQKSANMGAVQKKKMQTSAKSFFQFFARLHFLTQIFAHSCIKV